VIFERKLNSSENIFVGELDSHRYPRSTALANEPFHVIR
jgi:hypothetical protein